MTENFENQLASTVLTVRPLRFQFNPQTADSNRFMADQSDASAEQDQAAALAQYQGLVDALRGTGIEVIEFADTPEPHTPDSVFPNNWLSTHADGTVVTYPMEAPNRRAERRADIVEALSAEHGFRVERVVDLSAAEAGGRFLEGTGSLVLDRPNRIAYAALSSRTDAALVQEFADELGYGAVTFTASDNDGVAIYHTNVMMCVGSDFAVVCLDCIGDPAERKSVADSLRGSGHAVIPVTFEQVLAFAGNMLALETPDGQRVIALSQQALDSLSVAQRDTLASHGRLVAAPIDTIEARAGGSVRCMLAEIHLPRGG